MIMCAHRIFAFTKINIKNLIRTLEGVPRLAYYRLDMHRMVCQSRRECMMLPLGSVPSARAAMWGAHAFMIAAVIFL